MLKQFEGLKKRHFCYEVEKRYYKHGETTTCVLDIFIPISHKLDTDDIGKYIVGKFPNLSFTFNQKAEYHWGFSTTIVATAIPTMGDVYDEKAGETISYSKCQKKAYSISSRLMERLSSYLTEEAGRLEKASAFMDMAREREINFLDSL